MNIPRSVLDKVGQNLHLRENHPISIVANLVIEHLNSNSNREFAVLF